MAEKLRELRDRNMEKSEIARPEFVEDYHLEFLDELRLSGQTNMFGAAPYLVEEFLIDRKEAREILGY